MIEFTTQKDNRTFYIVFDKCRGVGHWWDKLLSDGFNHVWLLTNVGNETICISPTTTECTIDIWPCTIEEAVSWLPDDTTAILRYTSNYKNLKKWRPRGIIYCVTSIKYMLGIDGLTATPKGLYKQLLKLGASNGRKNKGSTCTTTT